MQTQSIEEDEIDLKELFGVLSKHKKKILFFMLLFGFLAAIFAYLQPNIYSVSSTIEIESKKSMPSSDDILSMAMTADAVNVDTEIEIIKSRQLITKVLNKINFVDRYYVTKNYKEQELYNTTPFKVNITKGKGYSFIIYPMNHQYFKLKVAGIDPDTSVKWESEIVCEYAKEIVEKYFVLTLSLVDEKKMLDKALSYRFVSLKAPAAVDEVQRNLKIAQTTKQSSILKLTYMDNVPLRAIAVTNALADEYLNRSTNRKTEEASRTLRFIDRQLGSINKSLQNSESNLEKFKKKSSMLSVGTKADGIVLKLSEYESKLAEESIQEKMLDNLYTDIKKGKNLEDISAVGLNLQSEGIPNLIKTLQDNIIKKKILREEYAASHPELKKLSLLINQTKKRLANTLRTLKIRVSTHKNLLKKTIHKYEMMMKTLPEKEKVFGNLLRSFSVNEKIYSYLLEKRAATAIAKAATVNQNRILDRAIEIKVPVKPKRKLIVIIGLILGLIFGVFLAFIREFMDDTIKKVEDIEKFSAVPVIGTIPILTKKSTKVTIFESPKSMTSEAFRALRSNLQFLSSNASLVISVTSTVAGEGKTTIAANLASIISLTGKKTIVLNLDMRKPTLHKKFGLANNKGMSSLLSKHASLEEVIQETEYANLSIISSGPTPPNPSELILGEEMQKTIVLLKEQYDVILFDTPPVGLISDAITLIQHSDITLYVLRAEYSKKSYLKDINTLVSRHNIKGFSFVLNGMKKSKEKYGYGYGYYDKE